MDNIAEQLGEAIEEETLKEIEHHTVVLREALDVLQKVLAPGTYPTAFPRMGAGTITLIRRHMKRTVHYVEVENNGSKLRIEVFRP